MPFLSALTRVVSRLGLDGVRLAATIAGIILLWFWIYLFSQDQRPIFGWLGGGLLTLWLLAQFALELRRRWAREDSDATLAPPSQPDALTSDAMAEALDHAPTGVILVEADWKISLINKAAIEMLKVPPALAKAGVDGRDILRLQLERGDLGEDSLAREIIQLPSMAMLNANVINSQQAHPVFERRTPDGRTLEIRTRMLSGGRLIRTYADITPRIAALEATRAALLSRSQFLGAVSHELRTPLNAVIGLCHVLQSEPLTPRQQQDVQSIADAGQQLLGLVDDVLAVASLDKSGLVLKETVFDLPAALRRAADGVQRRATAKSLSLDVELAQDLPEQVIGDEDRLCSALAKLLDNAVKFTAAGGVILRAAPLREDHAFHRIVITVQDSGPGVAAADLQNLFDPFTQGDGSNSRRKGGIGGGLTLARLIVTAMGGQISLASDPGQGCVFRIELPLARVTSSSP
ncbi:MAG: sensor histidine kinase [Elsteraceae bacterium]